MGSFPGSPRKCRNLASAPRRLQRPSDHPTTEISAIHQKEQFDGIWIELLSLMSRARLASSNNSIIGDDKV